MCPLLVFKRNDIIDRTAQNDKMCANVSKRNTVYTMKSFIFIIQDTRRIIK